MSNTPDPEAFKRPADVKEKPADLLARVEDRYGAELVALCRMLATMSEVDWALAFNLLASVGRERLATVETDIMRHAHHGRRDKAAQLGQFLVLYARLIDIGTAAHHAVTSMSGDGPAERVNLFVDLFSAVCAMIGTPDVAPPVPAEMQHSGVAGIWPNATPGRPAGTMPAGYTVTPAGEPPKQRYEFAQVPPLASPTFQSRFHNPDGLRSPVQLRAPHGYKVMCSRCGTAHDLSGEPLPVSEFQCDECGAFVDCTKRPAEPQRSDKSASPHARGFPPGSALT